MNFYSLIYQYKNTATKGKRETEKTEISEGGKAKGKLKKTEQASPSKCFQFFNMLRPHTVSKKCFKMRKDQQK